MYCLLFLRILYKSTCIEKEENNHLPSHTAFTTKFLHPLLDFKDNIHDYFFVGIGAGKVLQLHL